MEGGEEEGEGGREGYWLSEHLLEVYSVHEHGGSELQETETNHRSPDH